MTEIMGNAQMGWICPKCGAVMSPWAGNCVNCTGKTEVTTTTKTEKIDWTFPQTITGGSAQEITL